MHFDLTDCWNQFFAPARWPMTDTADFAALAAAERQHANERVDVGYAQQDANGIHSLPL
jgi:hypothetical protein